MELADRKKQIRAKMASRPDSCESIEGLSQPLSGPPATRVAVNRRAQCLRSLGGRGADQDPTHNSKRIAKG